MRKSCLDYPIEIVEGVFDEGNAALADVLRKVTGAERPRVFLVADQNVVSRHQGLGTRIGKWVQENGVELAGSPVLLPGGERMKDDGLKTALDVVRTALKARIGGSDAVLALGGGTLLDVAGWSLSQVRGGIPVVRMPTTPTAAFDAAYATYAALDSSGVKDAMRVKCAPAAVVIDPAFATTVMDGVWRAGFASALRHALVSDAALAKRMLATAGTYRERDAAVFGELLREFVPVMAKRGPSSFALWSAHRLEAMSDYKLPYGYALAIGIAVDCNYAVERGLLPAAVRDEVIGALRACGAMDGAMHSRHLLGQVDMVLLGLDAWKLSGGDGSIAVPSALGKGAAGEIPDRETMKRAVNMLK